MRRNPLAPRESTGQAPVSRISPALRRRVRLRARGLCEYCLSSEELTGQDFTVDHIVPEALGGSTDLSNLCLCCSWCNSFKQLRTQARDPQTGLRFALFDPRRDLWALHFRWSRDSSQVIAHTAIGRATLKALRLNRPTLVTARRVWARYGLHPPEMQTGK